MRYCAHFIIASKKFILLMLVSGGCIKKEEHPNVIIGVYSACFAP
jgi:hypothetical protein